MYYRNVLSYAWYTLTTYFHMMYCKLYSQLLIQLNYKMPCIVILFMPILVALD